jgi:WD repeat-containing protein 76
MAPRSAASLNEFERRRQEQIAKNQALLRDLALDAASTGLAPSAKKSSTAAKSHKKKPPPKKIKEEVVEPRRTSARLRGIVADSEVAKRKAEEEHEALQQAERAKRQRISDAINLGEAVVAGREWDRHGNFLGLGPAKAGLRTFDNEQHIKTTNDKELRALRERMSGLQLWEDFEPGRK